MRGGSYPPEWEIMETDYATTAGVKAMTLANEMRKPNGSITRELLASAFLDVYLECVKRSASVDDASRADWYRSVGLSALESYETLKD